MPAAIDTAPHDYTTGDPRHHHSLYLDDGNFVIQVENAIFKVHRSVLTKYSSVIKDMLSAPQGNDVGGGGTDEEPLILTGDSVASWDLLLGWQYERPRFSSKQSLSGEQLLSILPIAHKYCMESIEEDVLDELNRASSTAGYVDLLVAAQIVGSDPLYQKALDALRNADPRPDLVQAKRIGVEATYAILTATAQPTPSSVTCVHCQFVSTNWQCIYPQCRRRQH